MRVYVDRRTNVLYIEGVSSGPSTDYQVSAQGDLISIYRPSLALYDLAGVDFRNLADQNGAAFPDALTCLRYLEAAAQYAPLTAIYPLQFNADTQTLRIDKSDFIDGGNF